MSKYYGLVAGAIAGVDNGEARHAIYERVRKVHLAQLHAKPSLSESEMRSERLALEQAIHAVEMQATATRHISNAAGSSAVSAGLNVPSIKSSRQRLVMRLALGIIVVQGVLLAWLLANPTPSTAELDADLIRVRDDIQQADAESEKYGSSALKNLIEVRKQTLLNTEALLSQKRGAALRRVYLNFEVDGAQLRPASAEELSQIQAEIEKAKDKLAQSQKNANQYAGGLLQAMALMNVATDEVALSQLWLKFYSAKYGLPLLFSQTEASARRPPPSAGTVTKDRDAL